MRNGNYVTATGHFTEEQAKRVIPRGYNCHDKNGVCPFWDTSQFMPKQQSGYCHWLERGDWQEGVTLLWDQCKECGINIEDELDS